MKGKQIAVMMAQADEPYQQELVRGIVKKSQERGYNVKIFSMYIKYQDNEEREVGDSNIFNLIPFNRFDALILFSDLLQTPGVERQLQERIHTKFSGPVVCVDTDTDYFYHFWTVGYDAVYAEISHIIEKHHKKDIAYLTGRKNHVHSQRRLQAYRDAMEAHGLPVREDRIFYGDFWYTSGTGCAEALLRHRQEMPEAIVCANDCMAIGLADVMEQNGIKIPEDIGTIRLNQTSNFADCKQIRFYTIQAFKGLEAKAVIMIDVDSLSDENKRFLNYVGMSRVPVNDATAISFLTPMIAGFLAVKLLGEKAPKSINYAFIVAIIGVIVIKRPTFDIDNATIGYLALLAYTCIRAYIVILDKRLTSKFDPMTMMFYSCIILGLFAGCFFPFFIKVPLSALKYIAISGFLFFVEYYCIFRALKLCNAVILQPLDFSKLIFTMIFSYIFLGQQVNAHQIIGGSIIILGYLIVFIETKIKNTAK